MICKICVHVSFYFVYYVCVMQILNVLCMHLSCVMHVDYVVQPQCVLCVYTTCNMLVKCITIAT